VAGGINRFENLTDQELQKMGAGGRVELARRRFQRNWELSWQDLEGQVLDREQTRANIKAAPTPEELARWAGMSPEQIDAEIDRHMNHEEKKQIGYLRSVAEIDSIAGLMHRRGSRRFIG